MPFLGWILQFFGGSIIDRLTTAYTKHLDADTEQSKIKADVAKKQLDNEIETQKLQAQIRAATAGFWEMRLITALTVAPFLLHLWLVAMDTCFGFGWRIAAFPAPFDDWEGRILLAPFGIAVAGKAITSVVGGMIARRQ